MADLENDDINLLQGKAKSMWLSYASKYFCSGKLIFIINVSFVYLFLFSDYHQTQVFMKLC